MTLTKELLRAKHIGVRELGRNVSGFMKSKSVVIVEVKGQKNKVIISQDDLLDLIELLDNLQDKELLELVRESRAAVASGEKEVPVENARCPKKCIRHCP